MTDFMDRIPYEFDPADAQRFADEQHIRTRQKGNELVFDKCPYCGRTSNDKEKFSINLTTGQFHCFRASCGKSGNMITLAQEFDFSLSDKIISQYIRPKKTYKKLQQPDHKIEPKPEAISYLTGRKISEAVISKYEITVRKDNSATLCFSFFDEKKTLQTVKYRKTDFNKDVDKSKEWFEAGTKPILYGMWLATDYDKPLIITEGQIDALSVATANFDNATSVPNGAKAFTWIPNCWDYVNRFKEIIVFGDYERGEITLLDEIKNRFRSLRIKYVLPEYYKDCKDANDLLKKYGVEAIENAINHAEEIPVTKVVSMSDVQSVDIESIPKLQTGIMQLDRALKGGLPFGGLTILSGKPGEGKSTLASQIMISGIEQGYNCFAYSGELENNTFKAWTDFQIAGPDNVQVNTNSYGDETYSISKVNRELITSWYDGHYFLYDNSAIAGDEKENLIRTIQEVISRYNVKVLLLDNLMTAMELEEAPSSDKYERQSQFVTKLSRMAMEYHVLIILVAHKRKNAAQGSYANDNDEVSGSADIINRATIVIGYEKIRNAEETAQGFAENDPNNPKNKRMLKLTKNRLTGYVNNKGWEMKFDAKSRRVYNAPCELTVNYSWKNTFEQIGINTDNPFT